MRLTLRTLLAYMDDILDPADHEELAKKIEASDFAGELIHRSRDTVRRLRLGAPEVLAGEDDDVLNPDPASDANTVAEYLDNVLPPKQVAEFERVCLESGTVADMHLAEVTSCHHILTMVLGEPAEIDRQVRHRMYELPQRVEGGDKLRIESAHPPVVAAAPAPDSAPILAASSQPTVAPTSAPVVLPDYLRVAADGRRRRNRLALLAALFVIGCGTAFLFFRTNEAEGPAEVAHIDADAMLDNLQIGGAAMGEPAITADTATSQPVASAATESAAAGGVETATEPLTSAADEATGARASTAIGEVPTIDPVPVADDDMAVAESGEGLSAPPLAIADAAPSSESPGDAGNASATAADDVRVGAAIADAQTADTSLAESGAVPPSAGQGAPLEFPAPADDSDQSAAASAGQPTSGHVAVPLPPQDAVYLDSGQLEETTTTAVIPGDPLGIEGEDVESSQSPPEPPGPVQIGVYYGNNDVLLRLVPESAQWIRLPPRTTIAAGDTLLALPKYRIHVLLGTVNAYVSGGTQITIPEQASALGETSSQLLLEMKYGRLLLNAGPKGSDLILRIGGRDREFRLDSAASLAVEVHRIFVPGTDYTEQDAPVEVNWYLTSGSVEWGPAGSTETVRAPAAWTSVNEVDEPSEAVVDLPNWIDREPMTDLERRARDRFAEDIPIGQPVGLRLEELNSEAGAGREIRTLSAEASLYVGEFEPFVKSLNDSDQRVAWRSHIAAMRQALAMSWPSLPKKPLFWT